LTVALGQFYFLAATVGHPSVNQVILIFTIVLIDAIFPLIIGPALDRLARILWVIRGLVQSCFVAVILLRVPPSNYSNLKWSVALLTLMLVQLLILAPLGSYLQRRRTSIYDQSPNG
jgi:hypothetical protein